MSHKKECLISKEDLDVLYNRENISPNEIAKKFSVSRPTVLRWFRDFAIPMRDHKEATKFVALNQTGRMRKGYEDVHKTLDNYDWLYNKRIVERLSKTDIAKELDCSITIVNNYLKKLGIPIVKFNESDQKTKEKLLDKDYMKKLYQEGKTMEEIANIINSSKATVSNFFKKLEIESKTTSDYDPKFIRISKAHKDISDYIKSIYNGTVLDNNRTYCGVEIDILMPEANFGIEFNGLFYHSEGGGKHKNYHLNKTEKCAEKGIFLFHVFEDSFRLRPNVIFSMISNKLKCNTKKYYARQLEIREVPKNVRRNFFDENHIQGKDSAFITYGLYNTEELLCCASFSKSRYDKSFKWELMRFANKNFTNVVGGFSKLLNHFCKNNKGSIVTFSDKSYSEGNVYKINGFKLHSIIPPDYSYLKHFDIRIRKNNFKKKQLLKMFPDVDKEMSEYDIMKSKGYDRIWNCGLMKWVLE
jgi:transposase